MVAVPICVHGSNDWRITGWGGCALCAWVNQLPRGKQACRASREEYLEVTRMQDMPVTFVCHMGFTCVIASVLKDDHYTLVLGPYLPEDGPQEIKFVVEEGLAALGKPRETEPPLPFSLEDIRTVPEGSIRATAEWILDEMRSFFYELSQELVADSEETSATPGTSMATARTSPSFQKRRSENSPVEVSLMALSLLCGRTKEPRAFLMDVLDENERHPEHIKPGMIRAVSELLEAAKRQGGNIESVWNTYAHFVASVNALNNREELLKEAEKVLRKTARTCAEDFVKKYTYLPKVVKTLHTSYTKEKLLTETAESTGVALSTITRMVEKKTGATFSELLGRVRILHARRLLRTTDRSATIIARLVGIHDQANFGKLFKRYCNCTPGAYRARFRR